MTPLATIPADVSRRIPVFAVVFAVLAVACSNYPHPELDLGSGQGFIPQSADFLDNVGLGSSVVVSADGVPYVSYFGFPQVLKKDQLAPVRPPGAPFLPGVLVTNVADGIWNRGAVAMVKDAPSGLHVPFGPQTLGALSTLSQTSANGTDIALDGDGGLHVVWTGDDGVWYADGDPFAAERIFRSEYPLSQAGPLGWPAVALSDVGVPWVAFTTDIGEGQQVMVATPGANGWDVAEIVQTALCAGCPQPKRTEIAVTDDGPVVAYADNSAGAVMAAWRASDGSWTTEQLESGVTGDGISMAVAGDGSVWVAYYTGDGAVHAAGSSGQGTGWRVSEAASSGPVTTGQTTGIAATDSGVYVAYKDASARRVALVLGDGSAFESVSVTGTAAGSYPSLGATPDGSSVYLAWYDTVKQDLLLGFLGDTSDAAFARPSPAQTPSVKPVGAQCDPDGTTDFTITAGPGAQGAGFEETCIAVVVGQDFTVTFDNQDAGVGHNLSAHDEAGDPLFRTGEITAGPVTQGPEDAGPLDEGTYFFQCDAHPTTMTGVILVTAK